MTAAHRLSKTLPVCGAPPAHIPLSWGVILAPTALAILLLALAPRYGWVFEQEGAKVWFVAGYAVRWCRLAHECL